VKKSVESLSESLPLTPEERDALIESLSNSTQTLPRGTDHLLLCEHPNVYTMGRSAKLQHILFSSDSSPDHKPPYIAEVVAKMLESGRMHCSNSDDTEHSASSFPPIYRVDRGGDITFHGIGQLVGYPLLDLTYYKRDLHWYLRMIEEVIMSTCARVGCERQLLTRDSDYTGVWYGKAKVCAIGIGCTRWVTWHGFALNLDTDLQHFGRIVPCGISEVGRTVGRLCDIVPRDHISVKDVRKIVCEEFANAFNVQIIIEESTPQALIEACAALSKSN
jgi:lipoyl(octanoyl) transferase